MHSSPFCRSLKRGDLFLLAFAIVLSCVQGVFAMDVQAVKDKVARSTVRVVAADENNKLLGDGTIGFVIGDGRHVITCMNSIKSAEYVKVSIDPNNREYLAAKIFPDDPVEGEEIAILFISDPEFQASALKLADSSKIRKGFESVAVFGNEKANPEVQAESVVFESIGRDFTFSARSPKLFAAGAPICNENGDVVAFMRNSKEKAIPSNALIRFLVDQARLVSMENKKHFQYDKGNDYSVPFRFETRHVVAGLGAMALLLLLFIGGVSFLKKRGGRRRNNPKTPDPKSEEFIPLAKWELRVVGEGPLKGQRFILDEQRRYYIGRNSALCQISIPLQFDGVSAKHDCLYYDHSRRVWVLEDCNSTNGTFLESGEKLPSMTPYALQHAAVFYPAYQELKFMLWDLRKTEQRHILSAPFPMQ
jgi:hypothetical protein